MAEKDMHGFDIIVQEDNDSADFDIVGLINRFGDVHIEPSSTAVVHIGGSKSKCDCSGGTTIDECDFSGFEFANYSQDNSKDKSSFGYSVNKSQALCFNRNKTVHKQSLIARIKRSTKRRA